MGPDRLSEVVRTDRGTIRIRREPNGDEQGLSKPLTIIGRQELVEPRFQRLSRLLSQTTQPKKLD